jgi:hypothetical protein
LDVEALILDYCERYPYYRSYDAAVVVQDSNLRRAEIEIANTLDAHISELTIQRILDKHASIEECLSRISPDMSILDSGVSWTALQSLFEAIVMPYVRAATATKILHKKRSNLIPILDSVIQRYARTVLESLTSSETLRVYRSEAEEMVTYCQVLKGNVETNQEALVRIRQNLGKGNVDLSAVRILDIVIWSKFRS